MDDEIRRTVTLRSFFLFLVDGQPVDEYRRGHARARGRSPRLRRVHTTKVLVAELPSMPWVVAGCGGDSQTGYAEAATAAAAAKLLVWAEM